MEVVKDFDPRLSEIDLAYQILKAGGEPKSFRDLMQQVFSNKDIPLDNHQLMAAIHTEINLDHRFTSLGQGSWGLKEWTQAKVVRRNIVPTVLGRSAPFRRRSLQDELEYEDGDTPEAYEHTSCDDDGDEWEE